jgi:hypothetical protein
VAKWFDFVPSTEVKDFQATTDNHKHIHFIWRKEEFPDECKKTSCTTLQEV